MAKANEEQLNELHGEITQAFIDIAKEQEEVVALCPDTGELKSTGEMRRCAPPAALTAAAKFLKDNDIVVDKAVENNMGELEAILNKKKRYSRLTNAEDAAESLQ